MGNVTGHLNTGQHAHVRACTQTGRTTRQMEPGPLERHAVRKPKQDKACRRLRRAAFILSGVACFQRQRRRRPLCWCVEAGFVGARLQIRLPVRSGSERLPSATFKTRNRRDAPSVSGTSTSPTDAFGLDGGSRARTACTSRSKAIRQGRKPVGGVLLLLPPRRAHMHIPLSVRTFGFVSLHL